MPKKKPAQKGADTSALTQREGEKEVAIQQQKSKAVTETGRMERVAGRVFVRPVLSEKALYGEAKGVYTFLVDRQANKTLVKQAVKEVYGVTPRRVRIVNVEGKQMRFGAVRGRRKDVKKAVVTLPEGKTIQVHEGV